MVRTGPAYLPNDRYFSLINDQPLPQNARGAVLFADISGFTPLTEAYANLLGARLGAEELARQLNRTYDALLDPVDAFGGSVVSFSGDAVTCWFWEDRPTKPSEGAAVRALACAVAMQDAMIGLTAILLPDGREVRLGVKIAVSDGLVHRYLVGDPDIHLIDILAGDPVSRVAAMEHALTKGEVGVDQSIMDEHAAIVETREWRWSGELGEQFACISQLRRPVKAAPWPNKADHPLPEQAVRPWLFPEVYKNLQLQERELAAELRPVAALFMRFRGIDYLEPDAGQILDNYVRRVQHILGQYDAPLVQVSLGDKGSYLYSVFGAPVAHEDYARRAVSAAMELRATATELAEVDAVQIGISQGTVWVGSYGSLRRQTYGVHADEVNVAARLMQHAQPHEILVTGHLERSTASEFLWEALKPITVKGKSQPLSVYRLHGRRVEDGESKPTYSGALIGRDSELQALLHYVNQIKQNQAVGVVYVAGEAGMGKSRLIYELVQRVNSKENLLWVSCPSDELFRDSLHPFRYFLRKYFRQSAEKSHAENQARFKSVLNDLIVELGQRLSTDLRDLLIETEAFLGTLVGLEWENAAYLTIEPQERFDKTIAGLLGLLKAESLRQSIIIHVEDGQWLDHDSREVLQLVLAQQPDWPIGVIITCRFEQDGRPWSLGLTPQIPEQTILLNELSQDGVAALAEQVLGDRITETLSDYLRSKTGGNPFFVEQFVLDLHERGLLERSERGEWRASEATLVEVPTNVSAILIARLDRLPPRVKTMVQTGAVLGNEVETRVLSLMLPTSFNVPDLVNEAVTASMWAPSGDSKVVFRHTLLRDAAYNMQLSTTVRELHHQASLMIESVYGNDAGSQAVELAYHCTHAQELARAAQWYARAGDNALKTYALEDVIAHYENALSCWQESSASPETYRDARLKVLLELGNALRWRNRAQEAQSVFSTAYEQAGELGDLIAESDACIGLAAVQYDEGDFRSALANALRAEEIAAGYGISRRLRTVLEMKCWCLLRLGRLEEARLAGEGALKVSVELGEHGHVAQSLSVLGLVLMATGEMQQAIEHFEHALAIATDPMDVVGVTNNLGVIAMAQGDYERAASRYEEALALARQHKIVEAELVFRSNLGGAYVGLERCHDAETELREVIVLVGDSSFGDLSETYRFLAEALLGQGRLQEAFLAAKQALALGQAVRAPEFIAIAWRVLGQVTMTFPQPIALPDATDNVMRQYSPADCFSESLRICEDTGMKGEIPRTLRAWAQYELHQGHRQLGLQMLQRAIDGFELIAASKEVERTKRLTAQWT